MIVGTPVTIIHNPDFIQDVTLADGSVVNGWWLQIDIGTNNFVTSHRIYYRGSSANAMEARKFKIVTSLTGADGTWIEISHHERNKHATFHNWEVYTIEQSNYAVGRYIRMVIMEADVDQWGTSCEIMEWQLNGVAEENTTLVENWALTVKGNAAGDDFNITSTFELNDAVILPSDESEENILTLMKTEILKSDNITNAQVSGNELIVTGNAAGDDFDITSTIDLNPLELVPIVGRENEFLTIIKNRVSESNKINSVNEAPFDVQNHMIYRAPIAHYQGKYIVHHLMDTIQIQHMHHGKRLTVLIIHLGCQLELMSMAIRLIIPHHHLLYIGYK